MAKKNTTAQAKKDLQDDFEALLKDTRRLLDATSNDVNERTKDIRKRIQERVDKMEEQIDIRANINESLDMVDDFVHKKPYTAIGGSLFAGILLGMLFRRKDRY